MKKSTPLFALILPYLLTISVNCNCQTYRAAYDNSETSPYAGDGYGQGYSRYINIYSAWEGNNAQQHILSNGEFQYMESYITMFKATHDKRYLDKYIIHAMRVQRHRDDNLQSNLAGVTGTQYCNNLTDLPTDQVNPDWQTDMDADLTQNQCDGWKHRVLWDGMITYSMAEFVYLMYMDSDFTSLVSDLLPTEVSGTTPDGCCSLSSYGDFTGWLRDRVNGTLQHLQSCNWGQGHVNTYSGNSQDASFTGYNQTTGPPDECLAQESNPGIETLNMQTAPGKTLAMMYLVENSSSSAPTSNSTYASTYLQDLLYITELFKNVSTLEANPQDASSYQWCNDYACVNSEDIVHAFGELQFASICYQNSIPNFVTNSPLFTSDDIKMFLNTFTKHLNQSPLIFGSNVRGDNPSASQINLDLYGFLCDYKEYNPYVYQIMSDYFEGDAIYNTGSNLNGYAYLALYENLFNPIAIERGTTNLDYNWNTATSGDFDGSGNIKIASVFTNTYNTDMRISHIDNSQNIDLDEVVELDSSPEPYAGLASGSLNNSTNDYIIGVSANNISVINGDNTYMLDNYDESGGPLNINTTNLSPGIYYWSLVSDNTINGKGKFVIIKTN